MATRLVGKLRNGKTFELPLLRDPFEFSLKVSASDLFKVLSLANVLLLFTSLPDWFFLAWFAVWRMGYNVGLGYLLRQQSNKQAFTKFYQRLRTRNGALFRLAQRAIYSEFAASESARLSSLPDEAAAWMLFRVFTDLVLNMDVASFFLLCLKLGNAPALSLDTDTLLLYGGGALLFVLALWGKRDAYRVIGAFAWYWGDFFFLCDQDLNFTQGVYAFFPHPMYTVGYLWKYGLALVARSLPILYATLFAHALQFLFLIVIENPHIDKTYNVDQAKETARRERSAKRQQSWNAVKQKLNDTERNIKQKINDTERNLKQRASAIVGKIARN